MANLGKFYGIAEANLGKIFSVAKASLASVYGLILSIGGNDANTVLMLHMDGADEGTTFTDDSQTTPHTVTATGNAVTKTGTKKFGTASGFFAGTDDYLHITQNVDLDFGAGDFTVDMWVYHTDAIGNNEEYYSYYTHKVAGIKAAIMFRRNISGELGCFISTDGTTFPFNQATSETISSDAWHHIAIVRSSNTIYPFIDGVLGTFSDGSFSGTIYTSPEELHIGCEASYSGGETFIIEFVGYMDELRVSKGIARWTSNFTPPTSPYTRINMTNGIDEYTKLMLHMDGIDDGTVFTDSSDSPYTITRVNAVTKTGEKQFGTASGYFDGTGDYLTVPDNDDWFLSDGDFTLECWIKFVGGTASHDILGKYSNNSYLYKIYMSSDDGLRFLVRNNGNTEVFLNKASHGMTTGVWYHIAVVRNGTAFDLYLDGISVDSIVNSYVIPNIGGTFRVGLLDVYDSHSYIDEVRVSKGIARWTSNFTPPTSPYS